MSLVVGSPAWFWPGLYDRVVGEPGKPLAAIVVYIHDPGLVNLVVFDAQGNTCRFTSVPFIAEGAERPADGFFATLPVMP